MAFKFNGTAITFTPAIGEVTSVTFESAGREIEVSNSSDTTAIFEVGLVDVTATVEINGHTTATVGTSAAFTADWNDGTDDTIATGLVTSISTAGSLDGGITSTVVFKPTQ